MEKSYCLLFCRKMGFYYGREIYDAMIQGTIHTGDEAKVKQVYIENWKSDDSLWLN